MPYDYAVLDNGQGGSDRPRGGRKKRAAVARYVESKGGTLRKAGERTKREKRLRSEGRERFETRKAVRKYVTEKGGKLSPAGERGKREMRLRAEGRAAYLGSKKPNTGSATGGQGKGSAYPPKPPKPYGKYKSKSASGDSWRRGTMPAKGAQEKKSSKAASGDSWKRGKTGK